MLTPGDQAPTFTLTSDTGEMVSLENLLAQGPLVLYFYPADFTPVCTAEACMYRDAASELAAVGARVVGVSPQGSASKASFKAKLGLNFTLLADPGNVVAKQYGATGWFGLPFGGRRVTYLIGRDGKVLDSVVADFRVSKHAGFVKRAIEALNAGT
ncbi:MAG: redoxin domain-containing protein [Tepidisphaera sp.]|nr:redoxin domain-containing protein [Tepidisphaera sp.]